MIKLQIIGYLGNDAELRETTTGRVISFNVAHSENFKDSQGNPQSRTTWVRCSYWVDQIGILPFLVKGKLVYAEGIPSANAYLNKENQAAASIEMRVIRVELLGGKDSVDETRVQTTSKTVGPTVSPLPKAENAQTPATSVSEPEDDLPF